MVCLMTASLAYLSTHAPFEKSLILLQKGRFLACVAERIRGSLREVHLAERDIFVFRSNYNAPDSCAR